MHFQQPPFALQVSGGAVVHLTAQGATVNDNVVPQLPVVLALRTYISQDAEGTVRLLDVPTGLQVSMDDSGFAVVMRTPY